MKIAMPVAFPNGQLNVVEDGTPEAVQASVVTTVRCSPGDRLAQPSFGTEIPLFDESTVDVVGVVHSQAQEWVPDAEREQVAAALSMVPA